MTLKEILKSDDPIQLKALFAFSKADSNEAVLVKFNIWARKHFTKYFSSPDAPFHKEIDTANLLIYRGGLVSFINIAFKGAAKTARTKLFLAFCICNDMDHFRRYIKVLSEDGTNSTQIVTDVYNMLVNPKIAALYPEIFEKTTAKREETMQSFTTTTGVKMLASTVGQTQRGALQEDARPDLIWFEDFENRKTLRSGRVTKAIGETMEEARTGLAKGGSSIYTCNYISEQGNVHKLVTKETPKKKLLIQSILNEDGTPSWSRYTAEEVEDMRTTDEDFEGERLCKPSASKDVYFDRDILDALPVKPVEKTIANFKIYKQFNPSHRYGSGHDVSGGVGLDSSTSVFIDFDTIPAQVVATYALNTIKPDVFGDEVHRQSNIFGGCMAAVEKNNHGHTTIARLKQLDQLQYLTKGKETKTEAAENDSKPKEYGWHTNGLTKTQMLTAMKKAIEDGLIHLNDPDLIAEFKSYTLNDLIDDEKDPRMTTRHFDLLIGACIAWQTKDYAVIVEPEVVYEEEPEELLYPEIGM